MCRTQCVLALIALSVGFVQSWDIAVGVGDQLIFYTDETITNTVTLNSRNITALAYDEVHDIMLYVDKQSSNDSVCGYSLSSTEHKCFIERNGRNIQGIAFDPPTQTLFFTDANDNSINWISLRPQTVNNVHGNLLIKMNDRTPSDITVDSCRGYIYWTNTNSPSYKESLERILFNGSQREIIGRTYNAYQVLSAVIDPLTQKIYYSDGYKVFQSYTHRYLNRANLNGKNEINLNACTYGKFSAATEVTVSKDYLYWVNSSDIYNVIWQLPKNASTNDKPEKICTYSNGNLLAIATNYKIEDQIQGIQDCEALSSLIPINTVTNDSVNTEQTTATEPSTEYTTEIELFCVHGSLVHLTDKSVCECTPGYIGERCDVSACVNFCLQGNCSSNEDGFPTCSCNAGYSGQRCEVYACHGYCLNDGDCSLNMEGNPACQCTGSHKGLRCETDISGSTTDTSTYELVTRNISLVDLLSNKQKSNAKITITVEV